MTTAMTKLPRKESSGGPPGKKNKIKRLKNQKVYFLFVSIVAVCFVSVLFLAWHVPTDHPSQQHYGFLKPYDRMQRKRGKASHKLSIQDVMKENSLEMQISHMMHKNNAQQHGEDVPDPDDRSEIGRAWGNNAEDHRVFHDGKRDNANSCDRLFGPEGMVEDPSSRCIVHTLLKWVVCPLPPLRLDMKHINVSYGNHTVKDVLGRKEKDERILWTEGSVEISGSIPQMQIQTQLMEDVIRFFTDGMHPSSTPIEPIDDILNILVFRETYASTDWGLRTLYQAYAVLRHMKVTDNFRILFMDGYAATATDDAWVKLFGTARVSHLRNFVEATGVSTLSRSIVIQPVPSPLGNEAVTFYRLGDKCTGRSYLRDFCDALLKAYGLRRTKKADSNSPNNRIVTILYEKPFLAHPRSKIPENWTAPDSIRIKETLHKVYNVSFDQIHVATLDGLSFREQVTLLSETDLLISPNTSTPTLMSIFLPSTTNYVQFRGRASKRLPYILNTLNVIYEKSRMPAALSYSGLFDVGGKDIGPNDNELPDVLDNPSFRKTCDSLLGWDVIERNGTCRSHTTIAWTVCALPPLRFRVEKIYGSQGNESVAAVRGRKEAEELLVFAEQTVESLGSLDPTMVESCPRQESVQRFWKAFSPLSHDATFSESVTLDTTPTMLVFRDTYANPCWSILMAYQTWLMKELFGVGDNFRILWMDGHAYTGMDDFWRDVFGPEVYHFKRFVSLTGITAFDQSFVVHAGRMPLGEQAVKVYQFGSVCSPNSTLHDFRRYVLQKYGYKDETIGPTNTTSSAITNTTKKLTLLIRKPYVAHPRADGIMDRMVHDVKETVDALRAKYPDHDVTVVSFEGLPFREQLQIIRETDLLVAVHGAGNIHVLFLPYHAKFLELYPKGFSNRVRFQFIANALGIFRRSIQGGIHRKVNSIIEMSLAKNVPSFPDF
eukprot:scaffold2433_cov159-Amphora_coffeaeformis.AAC.3